MDVVGQAGGYASRGFARLGRSTRCCGPLGEDPAGRMVRQELHDVPLAHVHLANWARGCLLPNIGTIAEDL